MSGMSGMSLGGSAAIFEGEMEPELKHGLVYDLKMCV